MNEKFDLEKYKRTLRYAALLEDIKYLTHGDKTQIAEKGDSLSGG
jgi:ABC-type bacteriocin/lantibiotic exporter with double-glycine peptidase domain